MPAPRLVIPGSLGNVFSVRDARSRGVSVGRLRQPDLIRPFRGVRMLRQADLGYDDDFTRVRADAVALARAYAQRMRDAEFFCGETAVHLYGGPLPLAEQSSVHVGVFRPLNASVARGVHGHTFDSRMVSVMEVDGLRVASPASVWAMLGSELDVPDLVVLGDYFCRVWREEGYYRVNPGMPPLATPALLADAVAAGRRTGAAKLRAALPLIRTDSWSPRESLTRYHLQAAALPEPVLNRDFYDSFGEHLACLDIAYPEFKVAVEYQSRMHAASYGKDIERLERLRANGWVIVQVTAELLREPAELVRRVRAALRRNGWVAAD